MPVLKAHRRMVSARGLRLLSWAAGILGICAIVVAFRPTGLDEAIESIGIPGALLWLCLTLVARIFMVETTVRPVRYLGYELGRVDAFWVGWVRTFGNQVIPLSGLAFYLREIVRRSGIAWSEVTSLATPQVFLALASVGCLGFVSVLCGASYLGLLAAPLALFYLLMSIVALLATFRADWLIRRLPGRLSAPGTRIAATFRRLAQSRVLIVELIAANAAAILVRGGRLWVLFVLTATELTWQQALLIIAIAESATILQLTPGGLGLREGAVVGAAALVDVSQSGSVIVALVDRLLMVGTATLLLAPAFAWLRRRRPPKLDE